jgi:diacylglycerol O-acyltransferase
VVSYDGGVFFGLAGDRRALADIDDLAAALQKGLDEQTGRLTTQNM